MATTIEYALLAGASYYDTRADINRFPVPMGWAKITNPDSHFSDPATGFEAIAFQNGTDIIISYAGTGPGLNVDWVANCNLTLGIWSDQLGEAAAYYLQVKALNTDPNTHIAFTGHSLGGGLAALMSVFFGGTAMTFDQAPFAASATSGMRDQLVTYLEQHGYTAQQLADLAPTLMAPNFDPAVGAMNVTGISVSGEALTLGNRLRIGLQIAPDEHGPADWFLSSIDLHSQALLTTFLQSNQTAAAQHALSDVTVKLPDLLKMIFDPNLFYNDPNRLVNPKQNLIEHLVQQQAAVTDPATGMVSRFNTDLWKLAQDGGLTMTDGNPTNAGLHEFSDALIAFAMQKYYEEQTAGSTLFSDVSGGIQFDMADVSKTFAAAITANEKFNLSDAKGYQYFANYLKQGNLFTQEESALIKSILPQLRDWYVQAGASGMNATDTLNRGAFMLGGNGSDTIVGGTGADLLVGNAGNDILAGGGGNDTLLGGSGNDAYIYTTGDGLDTLLDTGGQNTLAVDGAVLDGGAEYGDAHVHRSADGKHLYVQADPNTLLIDGNIVIQNYGTDGSFGLTMNGASADINPTTTHDINGDPLIHTATIAPGGQGADWRVTRSYNQQYTAVDNGNGGTTNVLTAYDVDYYLIDIPTGNPVEGGGPERADSLVGTTANDHITSGALNDTINATQGGDDLIETGSGRDKVNAGAGNNVIIGGADGDILIGGAGNDRIYADTQMDVATAIAQGNAQTGSGLQGDWLAGGDGNDTLVGSTGNDVLSGGGGADLLIGGAGDDDILGDANYVATSFDWTVTSTNGTRLFHPVLELPADGGADVIYAGEGNDYVWAGAGNDVVFGEGGNDKLQGNEGNDIILGGTGTDKLWGDAGNDYLDGGDGVDELQGGEGDDILIGGKGNDEISTEGNDTIVYNLGDGEDKIQRLDTGSTLTYRFGAGIDPNTFKIREGSLLLDFGNGDAIHIMDFNQQDVFNSLGESRFEFADGTVLNGNQLLARGFDLDGTNLDDTIIGTNTTDRINGLGGNDTLVGLDGNDTLDGGAGNDTIVGDEGCGRVAAQQRGTHRRTPCGCNDTVLFWRRKRVAANDGANHAWRDAA